MKGKQKKERKNWWNKKIEAAIAERKTNKQNTKENEQTEKETFKHRRGIYTEKKKESLVTKPSLLKESKIIPE